MKCFLGISNFLEKFLVFPILLFSSISLHWSLRKAFLSLPAIFWDSAFRCLYLSFSPSLFTSLLFTAISKAHLTSHSRMSGSRWVITPSWLSGSWSSLLYSSSVYSCHLFLISSASVSPYHFCPLLSPSLREMLLGISKFLKEISSLSHSIVFLYFFALITEEGFLISPC